MLARLLDKFARWALSKNAPGPYKGEDDKRWAYVIETNGDPYLTRVLSPRLFGCRLYLHHFHRPDGDRNLHSHPWKWAASLILSGSYDEERIAPDADDIVRLYEASGAGKAHRGMFTRGRRVRWFNFLRKGDYHAVTKLHGDVWTLFLVGPSHGEGWGFLVDGEHVPWDKYLDRGDKP